MQDGNGAIGNWMINLFAGETLARAAVMQEIQTKYWIPIMNDPTQCDTAIANYKELDRLRTGLQNNPGGPGKVQIRYILAYTDVMTKLTGYFITNGCPGTTVDANGNAVFFTPQAPPPASSGTGTGTDQGTGSGSNAPAAVNWGKYLMIGGAFFLLLKSQHKNKRHG